MSTYFDCTLTAGFYSIGLSSSPGPSSGSFGEHTYAFAEKDHVLYAFPCMGGFARQENERSYTKNVRYPVEFWSPYMIGSRSQGRTLPANLYVALAMAQWNTTPTYDYRIEDWNKRWENPAQDGYSLDCYAGITYAVTGVCHQICNRILWSSQMGNFTYTPVNWPPSFSASYWVYGYWGKLTESVAIDFATQLVSAAQMRLTLQEPYVLGGGEAMPALDAAAAEAQVASLHATRQALAEPLPAARQQEVTQMVQAVPGGDQVVDSNKLSGLLAPDEKFHTLKAELDKQLLRAEVSHDEYANRINGAFNAMVEEFRNVLPPETFKALFGEEPAGDLIIRSQMPESYAPVQEVLRI